jgi:hypothetical protein
MLATMKLTLRSLSSLSSNVYQKLPREVRDIIYQYILTEHGIESVCRSSSLRLDKFPQPHSTEPASGDTHLPESVDFSTAFGPWFGELIEMLYESYTNFGVSEPSAIPRFLNTDFFNTGLMIKSTKLQRLRAEGCVDVHVAREDILGLIDHHNARKDVTGLVDLETLQSDLDALLAVSWTTNFEIEFAFHSKIRMIYNESSHGLELAKTLHSVWTILKPFIANAEARGATVRLAIEIGATTFGYQAFEPNMFGSSMPGNQEDWLLKVEKAYAGRHRRLNRSVKNRNKKYKHSPCPAPSLKCCAAFTCFVCCCGWVVYVPARWCWNKYKQRKGRK